MGVMSEMSVMFDVTLILNKFITDGCFKIKYTLPYYQMS